MDAKLLMRTTLHQGAELTLSIERVQLPNGVEVEFPMLRHPGAAAVVPLLPKDEIVLIRQYRWAAGGSILEVPAGKLRPGETPEACAARELREETGFSAGALEPLGSILTVPGFSNERIHLFLARDLTPVPRAPDQDELIEIVRLPLAQAFRKIEVGEIVDAKTQCAILRLLLRRAPPTPPRRHP